MSESGHGDTNFEDGGTTDVAAVRISSAVMVAAVIFLFMVVVFVFFLYLYARHFLRGNRPRSRSRFVFAAADFGPANTRRGLDPAVRRALPVTLYRAADFKEPLECAVCLSELADGEEARVLPKCGHGFHLECIDMWFHSHSTCPLCRCLVAKPNSEEEASTASAEDRSVDAPAAFPTNVLVCGNRDRFNAGSAGNAVAGSEEGASSSLVIEIPRRVMDGFPSPVSESKSPLSARFRTLRTLWSQGRRGAGPSCSPREGDIEQGLGGCAEGCSPPPKSP